MTEIPDLDIDRARDDFGAIFDLNSLSTTRIRDSVPMSGDFFNESTSNTTTETTIYLNIQGLSTAIQRLRQGHNDKVKTLHAYAKYDADIQEEDVIKIITTKFTLYFKINNYSGGLKGDGQYAFQEMDLELIKIL